MESDKLDYFKKKLGEESRTVENELKSVGHPSDEVAGGWEADVKDADPTATESDEKADKYEELEENEALVSALAGRLASIKHALKKIDDDSYGICEISHEPIEDARLEANPAARTCEKHMNEEKNLPL